MFKDWIFNAPQRINVEYWNYTCVEKYNNNWLIDGDKDEERTGKSTQDYLRLLGGCGWELVSVIYVADDHRFFYFKRPV